MANIQLEQVESNLRRLGQRPAGRELPVPETLTLRAIIILAREAVALLERVLQPAGVAESEFRLMTSLLAHGGTATAGDVCSALAQSPANLTRVADALVQRGYVSREQDETDRRRVLLRLQPEGEKLLNALLPQVGREVQALFAGFGAGEKTQLLDLLKRLLESATSPADGDA